MLRSHFSLLVGLALVVSAAPAQTLSNQTDIDFFRDVPSRNLKGLATRSDGRLVGGPTLREIATSAPAALLWSLEATPDASVWLLGTGPDGQIIELKFDTDGATFAARTLVRLADPQVFALKRLADGSLLAGTSPNGALHLIRDATSISRIQLPVDSIFDLLVLEDNVALVATGNPGRIYKVDLAKFALAGLQTEKIHQENLGSGIGITLVGEIRDRNIRRIALLPDGRIAAGSSPRGNIYLFPKEAYTLDAPIPPGPVILQENRDAEVTDLLVEPNGDLYATIVFSTVSGEARLTPPPTAAKGGSGAPQTPPPVQMETFSGRSSLVWFPAGGFPETLTSRANTAFYRLARHDNLLLIAGGEQGEIVGYDLKARLSLTLPGSVSAQLNGITPLPGAPGKFLLLRNNSPGVAWLDFNAAGTREAETRRLDLGTPALLGALRFNRLRNLAPADLNIDLRLSNGSDEVEGWGPWTPLRADPDQGWRAEALRGRYARIRFQINADGGPRGLASSGLPALELDRATLFALPQNRRPQLQDFRVLRPSLGLIPAAEQPPPAVTTLNQIIQPPRDDDRRKGNFLSSQVVPSPGAQVVLWTVTDPDGDALAYTFSIRPDGGTEWTDIGTARRESYVQFDTANLPDGVYFTRLVASETAPRQAAERLSRVFETDDLIVDHTPPEIVAATARQVGDAIVVTVHGRDQLSLLDGIEAIFSNGVREIVQQPADGVRDGREETFVLEIPRARISNATSVEVTLYDTAGNGTARRLTW